MKHRSKLLVLLGLAVVTLLSLAISDTANAQRRWRPNMYDRYGSSSRSYRPSYNYAYGVQQAETTQQSFSVEPIDIKAGDEVKVTVDTPLQIGRDVLTTVPAGQTHKVINVIGSWVGVAVEEDGQEIRGWVTYRALEHLH